MARARKVVSDQSSQEFDELRRQFNNLLLVLENACTEVAGATTADQAFAAIAQALTNGSDTDATNHVGTGRELNGVRPTPTHPRRSRNQGTEDMGNESDY